MQFEFSIYGAWWFSLIYLIFAYGLWFIFPKFVQIRFSKVPYIRIVSSVYKYAYILILMLTIFVSFNIDIYFYLGLIAYLLGLFMYISGIFYFSINELNLPVTTGIYKYFRHPIYLGFFIIFLGISLITSNLLIFILTLIIGYCSYYIALSEEKECAKMYGKNYDNYKKQHGFLLRKK